MGLALLFTTEELPSSSLPCSWELSVPVPASPLCDTTVWLRPSACSSRCLCHISGCFTDFSGPFFPPCYFWGGEKSPVTLMFPVVKGLAVPAQHWACTSYHKEPLTCLFYKPVICKNRLRVFFSWNSSNLFLDLSNKQKWTCQVQSLQRRFRSWVLIVLVLKHATLAT